MVDTLTRYYLTKANLRAADEFHDHIAYSDIDTLNKAAAYCFIAPAGTLLFVHFLKNL